MPAYNARGVRGQTSPLQGNWEYVDFLGNLGIFGGLTWDFHEITDGNTGHE